MPAAEAPPTPAAAPAPALAPAPKVEINVSQMKPSTTARDREKGPARAKLFADLEAKAGQPEPPKEAKKPELKLAGEQENEAAPAPEKGEEAAAAAKPGEKADEKKKEKVNPWKLADEHKAKRAEAEAKLLELEKRSGELEAFKKQQTEWQAKEKRLSELEEEIRFQNYKKSKPYQEMQEKYKGAWTKAMGTLGEIMVNDGGQERPMTPDDLLQLVNLSDVQAKRAAIEKYGDLEGLVMQHRDKIRELADQQIEEETKAKKEGEVREKTLLEQRQKEYGEVSGTIRETWSKANEEIKADPKYSAFFTPVDGDEQGNQRLAKGYEMADRAFSENPLFPGLSPEQRESIVRRHAAVRNRAAAFGRLVYQNGQKDAKIAELQKLVDEYKGTDPVRGGSAPAPKGAKKNTMDEMFGELRKKARMS